MDRIQGMQAGEFILHAGNMLLLDRLFEIDQDRASCSWRVPQDSPWHWGSEGVAGWTGIEYMAQCIAVLAGARAWCNKIPPPGGYLLGTRNFEIEVPFFRPGEEYLASSTELATDGNGIGAYNCSIAGSNGTIAKAGLTIFSEHLVI